MTQTATTAQGPFVLVGTENGVTLISRHTPLARLNYFDGKFLRADDLNREQDYLRSLVEHSNRAGGSGVVYGLDLRGGSGGTLELGAGLAIDPQGRVLYLPHDAVVDLQQLIESSARAASGSASGGEPEAPGFAECRMDTAQAPTVAPAAGTDLYLVVAAHTEARCGQDDVMGKLCEEACVTKTSHRYRMEGVVLRAIPIDPPQTPCTAGWPITRKHRRSVVASAYYAQERARLGRDMSGAWLRAELWCSGALAETGNAVPLAVVSVSGRTVEWIDGWIARRERMEAPSRRYWAWQMMMRPWDVFLAQVLQFQCHLRDLLAKAPPGGPGEDPCAPQARLLREAQRILEELERQTPARDDIVDVIATERQKVTLRREAPEAPEAAGEQDRAVGMEQPLAEVSVTGSGAANQKLLFQRADQEQRLKIRDLRTQIVARLDQTQAAQQTQVLVDGGILELPPAGYLPVEVGPVDVNTQVRRWMGEGVDLRFCVVRPDYVAHALEEAQHLERICLLEGLKDAQKRPEVDVLVPDGVLVQQPVKAPGISFEVRVRVNNPAMSAGTPTNTDNSNLTGGTTFSTTNLTRETDEGLLFQGAGRAEALESGGGAFHFAGVGGPTTTTTTDVQKVGVVDSIQPRPVGTVVLAHRDEAVPEGEAAEDTAEAVAAEAGGTPEPGAPAEEGAAETGEAGPVAEEGGEGGKERIGLPPLPGLEELRRLFGGGAGAAERAAAPAEGMDRATITEIVGGRQQFVSTQQTSVYQLAPYSVWATLRCERDPFALRPGGEAGTTSFSVELALARLSLKAGPRAMEFSVRGDLRCTVGGEGSASMEGVIRNAWLDIRATEDTEPRAPVRMDGRVKLLRRQTSLGATVLTAELTFTNGYQFDIVTSWRGSPVIAQSRAAIDWIDTMRALIQKMKAKNPESTTIPLLEQYLVRLERERPELHSVEFARADLRESADVLRDDNAYHRRAVQALAVLERALDDVGLREEKERLLFPPPPPKQAAETVRATRDWVLFHRRRRNTCDCCPPAQVVAPPRRYQVYHFPVRGDENANDLRRMLEGMQQIPGLETVQVVPSFQPGSSVLTTPRQEILDAWAGVSPGSEIVYGAVAAAGEAAADSDALHATRLDRVASVVDDVTPDPNAVYEALDAVPPTLAAGSLDGVMVFVTRTRAVCLRVYGFRDQGMMDFVLRQHVGGGTLAGELALNNDLGRASFLAGSSTPVGGSVDAVVQAWRNHPFLGQLPLARAALVIGPATPSSEAQGQAAAVAAALGGQLTDGVHTSQEALFTECHGVLLLEPGQRQTPAPQPTTRTARLVIRPTAFTHVPQPITRPEFEFQFDATGAIAGGQLPADFVNTMRNLPHANSVILETMQAADAQADTRLAAVVTALQAAGLAPPGVASKSTQLAGTDLQFAQQAGINTDDVIFVHLTTQPG